MTLVHIGIQLISSGLGNFGIVIIVIVSICTQTESVYEWMDEWVDGGIRSG